ncbi:MAG: BMP family ABC transporter substrate-binding protein [Chloroflexota bacterium]|nr:BMP family ABC transporter substrate-binding protein [Chloroflexota bacterium]
MQRSAPLPVAPLMRRFALALLLLAPLLALAGASGLAAQDEITVTMVTDTAGLGDQNFNDLAFRGLTRAEEELGVTGEVIESANQAAYVPNLTEAAEQSDLTVGVGFLLTDAMTAIAEQYPDDSFLIIDAEVEADNVASVLFKEQEGAFLAGVVAGLTTETNTVGVVGGVEIPPVVRYAVGFEAGVRSVNPEAEVIVAYADTFDDPALGRELTLAQYNQGADIVFPVAGRTGVGSFDAARERGEGNWVIAADTDQSQLGAEFQLAVATKGVDTALYTVAEQVVNGEFQGGTQLLGLAEGGVGLATPGDNAAPEVLAVAEQYEQAIIAGTIVVPATPEELEAFQPVGPDALGTPGASPAATPSM